MFRFDSVRLTRSVRGAGVAILVVLALIYRGNEPGWGGMSPQWWGILGLIGWAYLIGAAVYLCARGQVALLCGAIAVCAVLYVGAAAAAIGTGLAVHATHAAIVLSGTVCALLFFDGPRPRVAMAALFGAVLAVAGALLHQVYPISKIGATPPWALYCAALCTALFALLHYLIEVRRVRAWTALVEPAATSPLMTYLLPFVIGALMQLTGARWSGAVTHGGAAIGFALLFAFGIVLMVARLNLHNLKLKI